MIVFDSNPQQQGYQMVHLYIKGKIYPILVSENIGVVKRKHVVYMIVGNDTDQYYW